MAKSTPNEGHPALTPVPTSTPLQEAAHVLMELRRALAAHGITLPSLDLDAASLAALNLDPQRRPLIELGRVNLVTARQLTVALWERR